MASPPVTPSEPFAPFVPEFEHLVPQLMEEWKLPGLAVAVVQDGEVVFIRPYGFRDAEAGLKVTSETQFQIMSVTKSFTATGLALLVNEGSVDWNKPVREYIPEFRLHDAVASDRVTVRDLLCHHSGLPRHDWIWLPGDLSPAQMLAAMRYLEPSADIRSAFQYSNLGYFVASMVTERVSGQSWPDFIRARLADKLHMDVTFSVEELAAAADAAVPYAMQGDTLLPSQPWRVSATAAGGMSASIAGMATWLRFHLAVGEFEGQQLLSPARVEELQKPRVHVGRTGLPGYSDVHYGFGLRSHNYRGERVVWHGGGWTGTNAVMMMLPDRQVGICVLANNGMAPLFTPHILANHVFDRVCGREPLPWFERFRERRRNLLSQYAASETPTAITTSPSLDARRSLADYAGEYRHPGYGQIVITVVGDALRWAFRGMSEPLKHRHYDVFELPEEPVSPGGLLPPRLPVAFSSAIAGDIESVAVPFEPLVDAITFTRVAAGD